MTEHNFSGAGVDVIRRQNLSAALRMLHVAGPSTRSALAAATGLNRSTVAGLVGDLRSRGLVSERPSDSHGLPGRPSTLVEVEPEGAVVLGIQIFPDSVAVARIGLGGTIFSRVELEGRAAPWSPDSVIDALSAPAIRLMSAAAGRAVSAIGVAVAGLVRREDGVVVAGPNLRWRDVPIAEGLRTTLGTGVPIFVANDADLATLAESRRGAGVDCRDFLLLWGEVGVGAGVIAGGRPFTGRAGFAGEVGHMAVRPRGRLCRCGARGCWETEVGAEALLRALDIGNTSHVRQKLDSILADAAGGDDATLNALRGIGRWLGVGLAGLIDLLDPERIALGGFFSRAYPYLIESVNEEIERRLQTRAKYDVQIVQARLGSDAVLQGAGELALSSILDDPTTVPLAEPGDMLKGRPSAPSPFAPSMLTVNANPISGSY